MDKIRAKLKKIFTLKRVLFVTIFFIACLAWFKYIAGIILVVIFTPITIMIIRYSRFIPHVTADNNLAFACLMGFLFGPVISVLYALIVGMISLVVNSHVKIPSLASLMLAAVGSVFCTLLGAQFHMSFSTSFMIVAVVRTFVALPIFNLLGVSPIENISHQTSQMLCNLIIYLPLLSLLYKIIAPFV
ncbi:MAG: hypothetical protein ABIJ34_07315 [archaeon]